MHQLRQVWSVGGVGNLGVVEVATALIDHPSRRAFAVDQSAADEKIVDRWEEVVLHFTRLNPAVRGFGQGSGQRGQRDIGQIALPEQHLCGGGRRFGLAVPMHQRGEFAGQCALGCALVRPFSGGDSEFIDLLLALKTKGA